MPRARRQPTAISFADLPERNRGAARGDAGRRVRENRRRKPGREACCAGTAAPKSGQAQAGHDGLAALLAIAAAGYGVNYALVGRFYVSTDDAYVRANNTTLGARVSGHVAAILPADNAHCP